MEIESIAHKALRKFVESGKPKGIIEPQRVLDMLAFLLEADALDELRAPPNFGFHGLTGNRKGEYAMTVTKNWRMTFKLTDQNTIADLNLEDYH